MLHVSVVGVKVGVSNDLRPDFTQKRISISLAHMKNGKNVWMRKDPLHLSKMIDDAFDSFDGHFGYPVSE